MSDNRFYEQQIIAKDEILDIFGSTEVNQIRWVLLFAQMQSGKTGTYLLTACEMLRTGMVDNVVVFCGHSDVLLKEQTKEDARRLCVRERNLKKDEYGNIIKNNEYLDYLKGLPELASSSFDGMLPAENQIKVVFGSSNLNKVLETTNNTLFIWDESHFAQSTNNKPYEFLKQIGASPDGNQEALSSKGNYFLSVSATPFSELSVIHHRFQDKAVVNLQVSERYNSVEKMMNAGRIQFYKYKDMTSEVNRALSESATRVRSPCYVLIRTSEKNESLVIAGIDKHVWNVVHFNSKEDKETNSVGKAVWKGMAEAPEKHTVIIIRGRCRMGEVVKKAHISAMIETSKNSKTDTILQSFIGRACGYPEGSDRVVVFVPDGTSTREGLTKYVESVKSKNPRPVLPSKAKNVIPMVYRNMFPVKPIELKLPKVNRELNRHEILLCVSGSLSTPNAEWTFQQCEFAKTTANLIRKSTIDPETNFIISKKGKRMNRIEVHDVTTNLKSSAATAGEWTALFHNLYISKYDAPSVPEDIWRTTCEQVNEDGSKTIHEGYKVNLFYFKDANCSHSDIGNLNNDANTVYVYGVSPLSHEASAEVPNREPPQIPKTSGKEVFCHGLDVPTPSPAPRVAQKKEKKEEPPIPPPLPLEPEMNQVQLFSDECAYDTTEMNNELLGFLALHRRKNKVPRISNVKMTPEVNREFGEGQSIHDMALRSYKINLKTTLERPGLNGYSYYTISW